MKDMMSYKGYYGSVHYSDEDRIFHGKIEFIRSLISYEGSDVDSLCEAFEDAVDDYLDLCTKEGKIPEKPFNRVGQTHELVKGRGNRRRKGTGKVSDRK